MVYSVLIRQVIAYKKNPVGRNLLVQLSSQLAKVLKVAMQHVKRGIGTIINHVEYPIT